MSGGLALSSDLFSVSLVYVVLIKQGQAVRQKLEREEAGARAEDTVSWMLPDPGTEHAGANTTEEMSLF